MPWEKIRKTRKSTIYNWDNIPAIAVNKVNIAMNKEFLDTFGVNGRIVLLADKKAKKIGIKVLGPEEEDNDAFHVQRQKKAKAAHINVSKQLRKALGNVKGVYKARLDKRSKIVAVSLLPANEIRG